MSKTIFVSGATGFQGMAITKELTSQGYEVRALKSKAGNDAVSIANVNLYPGGYQDKEALDIVMEGVSAAVYSFPLIFDVNLAELYTINFIEAAKKREVELVIFNSNFDLPKVQTEWLALNLKVRIKSLLDQSGLNVITLMPDIYLDNLAAPWSIPVIMNEGLLPYPIASDVKIPWISHLDLGKYVASAITRPGLSGSVLPIGGNLLSGDEIAEAISKEIEREVKFMSITPGEFENQLKPGFGELAARESLTYTGMLIRIRRAL